MHPLNGNDLIDWVENRRYAVVYDSSDGYWLVTASPSNPAQSARGAGPTWRTAVNAAHWGETHPQVHRVEGPLV